MPAAIVCNKCRSCTPVQGDSWCIGCTAWQSIEAELTSRWDSPGARLIANDLVVSVSRQIRALRGLSAGLARSAGSGGAGISRATTSSPAASADKRSREPSARPSLPPPPPAPKREEQSSEELCEESEEEEEASASDETAPTTAPKSAPRSRPRTRPRSPQRREERSERSAGHYRAHPDRERTRSRRDKGERPRRGRRGGRKHVGLSRLANDPNTPIHRRASPASLELGSLARGRDALTRLG